MTYRRLGVLLVVCGAILISAGVRTFPVVRLVIKLPALLGFHSPQRYLVLLQNDRELRPTGGFLGSFAIVQIVRGNPDVTIEDIYVPDGQVKGHIDPPGPIQEAFRLGEWRLRDSNWDPDFPSTAKTIGWFMGKAGISSFDGTIAVNLKVFEDMLAVIGPLQLMDEKETITSDNLWEKTQAHVQTDFFPGSKQKSEFLSDLSKEFQETLGRLSFDTKLRIGALFLRELSEKNIMINVSDRSTQQTFDDLGWSGRVVMPSCPWWTSRCQRDSLMIVEANLGVNKANCCVEREAELTVIENGNTLHHELRVAFHNTDSESPWAGNYKAWVRVLSPGHERGFWAEVPKGETKEYTIEYDEEVNESRKPLVLLVQKQSGITGFPMTIRIVRGDRDKIKEIKTSIRKDKVFVL